MGLLYFALESCIVIFTLQSCMAQYYPLPFADLGHQHILSMEGITQFRFRELGCFWSFTTLNIYSKGSFLLINGVKSR